MALLNTWRWTASLTISVCLAGFAVALAIPFIVGSTGAAEPAAGQEPPPKVDAGTPPTDLNELSMEVAALRTLYLMTVWPDNDTVAGAPWGGVYDRAKENCAEKVRPRSAAKVSKNYAKVLAELWTAFVVNQHDRIIELSQQLEELGEDEDPVLDDAVKITPAARKLAPRVVNYFNPERIVNYLNTYGKEFPSPQSLVYNSTRGSGTGEKLTPETRAFVIEEVSWQLGGLDLVKQKAIGEKVAKLLDKADKLSSEETKNQWKLGGPLRYDFGQIKKGVGPTDVLKHVVEQDVAELLSNQRVIAAMDARLAYLKKKGQANVDRKAYEDEEKEK